MQLTDCVPAAVKHVQAHLLTHSSCSSSSSSSSLLKVGERERKWRGGGGVDGWNEKDGGGGREGGMGKPEVGLRVLGR